MDDLDFPNLSHKMLMYHAFQLAVLSTCMELKEESGLPAADWDNACVYCLSGTEFESEFLQWLGRMPRHFSAWPPELTVENFRNLGLPCGD
jgi:hypothetical protein